LPVQFDVNIPVVRVLRRDLFDEPMQVGFGLL
jgi:hypothetical protein